MAAEQSPKVKVTGRVGKLPEFRLVPDKKHPEQDLLVGNFSVAEHPDRDTTVWHDVAVFGERAQKLQQAVNSGEMQVGQEVEVVGTVHRRERPTKEGGTKTVEQIYAWEVKQFRRDADAGRWQEPHTPTPPTPQE